MPPAPRWPRELGAFPGYARTRTTCCASCAITAGRLTTCTRQRQRARKAIGGLRRARHPPGGIDHDAIRTINDPLASRDLLDAARECWDRALALGEHHGYRNAQTTVIAPTGTIGLLMDCDTTGVEPDFALVKFKKLAGGGYFKIANQSLRPPW